MGPPPNRARCAWITLLCGVFLTGFAVLFVDRAASTCSHEHFHRAAFPDWPTHIVDPLRAAAVAGLCAAGLAAAFRGWRPAEPGRIAIAASLAILVSFEIKEQLKHLFGRTWPETWTDDNPSWIRDHAYGLHPLHGGGGWESFPSGHTTQIAALAAVAWLGLPRLRWLGVALVAFGLWGSDYHFVGDILAGAFVGVAYGAGMVALLCPK